MNRRHFFFILICMTMTVWIYGNVHIIDRNNLPNTEAFNANMNALFEMKQFIDHYSPEWNYPVEKANLIGFLEAFHTGIVRINTKNDYELDLLNVVLMTYLYNLDETVYYEEIVTTLEKMKTDFPHEFRTYWLYGNFLVSAARPLTGYHQYKEIFNLFSNDLNSYSVNFLNDYAYACFMVQMPKTAMKIYELAAKNGGMPLSSNRLYEVIGQGFKDAEMSVTYTDKEIWEMIKSGDDYYVRNRMFGILLPVMSTWNVRMTGFNNGKSFCIITPDKLTSEKNNEIGITIMLEFDLNNLSYDDYLKEQYNRFPITAQTKKTISNHEYDIMVFEDETKYQNMGGSHGYFITTFAEYKNQSNSSIEIPLEFNNITSPVSYHPLKNYYNRIHQKINIGILVDSSDEIFNEASDFIFEYVESIIIE